jgi:hypothetical protein
MKEKETEGGIGQRGKRQNPCNSKGFDSNRRQPSSAGNVEAAGMPFRRFVVFVSAYAVLLYDKAFFSTAANSSSYLTPYLTHRPLLI